jgi:hypothetical protein
MTERKRWRRVPGWPAYKVSSRGGEVRGPRRLLTPAPDRDGYLYVTLRDGGRSRRVAVHVLVLEAFRGPCPPGHEGLHGPEGLQVNDLEALRWGTHRENERDKMRERNGLKQEAGSPPETRRFPVSGDVRQ